MKHILPEISRYAYTASGQVQGVGFRPFVYRLAKNAGLTGTVRNTSDGVRIEVQGDRKSVIHFGRLLQDTLPPLARLTGLTEETLEPVHGESEFLILSSLGHTGHSVLVSPDMGICDDCLADMRDPENPRYAYPFTNCTNCGPRYTITQTIPYDRASTSMRCFPLCPDCAAEYKNPSDRRFHAQPIACPVCGPRLWFVDKTMSETGPTGENLRDSLSHAVNTLLCGHILALKGLGGFQLACDARNPAAVRELRSRKARPHKPLALMLRNMADARTLCTMAPEHEALLQSPETPIVLCPRRTSGNREGIPPDIAPDSRNIGIMLPCTPLHAALFDQLAQRTDNAPVLVMTSANVKGEPLCLGNREALIRLADMADAWLLHDRDILARVDDSVLAVQPQLSGAPLFFRRARGYVPGPVVLPDDGPCVFGAGAELKNTFCLTRGTDAFVSQHIGDLENIATLAFYEEAARHLENLLEVRPRALVCDAHPNFLAAQYARERAAKDKLPLWELQHHAAHAASVLSENNCFEPALALCLDGTGLGTDGTVWGGEVILMDLNAAQWQRVGRLCPFALPGGDAAVREPWRIAIALQSSLSRHHAILPQTADHPAPQAIKAVREMLEKNLHCPQTSSCGRLFDAVSAQLGLCLTTTYEGQAAIRLEEAVDDTIARNGTCRPITFHKREGLLELDSAALFAHVLRSVDAREPVAKIAAQFHLDLACGLAEMTARAARDAGVSKVGLSGGVMQNVILMNLLSKFLIERGLVPLFHHALPPGDGGISFGQAVWGRQMLQKYGMH